MNTIINTQQNPANAEAHQPAGEWDFVFKRPSELCSGDAIVSTSAGTNTFDFVSEVRQFGPNDVRVDVNAWSGVNIYRDDACVIVSRSQSRSRAGA